jgi:hypothetical protein
MRSKSRNALQDEINFICSSDPDLQAPLLPLPDDSYDQTG